MTVTVFGASGRVGQLIVRRLLEQGESVVAFVHSKNTLQHHPNLSVVQGDIHSLDDVSRALKSSDAVMSALGSWGTESKDIVSSGMRTILPAMEKANIERIVSLTGTEAWLDNEDHTIMQKVSHLVFTRIASAIIKDGEAHMRLLVDSQANWTVLRSPAMTSTGNSGNYVVSLRAPKPWATAHREDVAAAMIEQLSDQTYIHKAPFISS